MWKIGCVIAVSLLCGCTDAVYMRNASGEIVKCGSVYTGLAGDFELMGIAARESQCIQDYKDQGFIRVPSAGCRQPVTTRGEIGAVGSERGPPAGRRHSAAP